ncbi:MAG: FAD-binding oxidoreductase [Candidatus Sericytochromatia bacterium]|nr:FAD-binding oxidoreductase [Candidatus Sericytochromatia bacterium]
MSQEELLTSGTAATHGRRPEFQPTMDPPDARFVPGPPPTTPKDVDSLDVWGFTDTTFAVNDKGNVAVTGNRYDGLSGQELPNLLPWFQNVTKVSFDPADKHISSYPPAIPEPQVHHDFMTALKGRFEAGQIDQTPACRLRHGHGQTQEEMYAIKHGRLPRIPDIVVFPHDDEQVAALVQMAVRHDINLIPFGGGTNVTDALRCPEGETRVIVSVDMRRMNRILWIDPINRLACIQAGAIGRHIMEQLGEFGWTMGHEPDSIEFSTLGGWIATHASGMKKNRYGNIEDIVQDVTLVSPSGNLTHTGAAPRESIGIDPRRWVFGSEGALGIITSAIVRLYELPEVQRFGSVLFKDFTMGLKFMYNLTQTGKIPASVRLVDNLQFQFGQALKPAPEGAKAVKSKLEKLLVTKVLGYEPNQMVACTLVFEGSKQEVAEQEAVVYRLAKEVGGMKAGEDNGKRGYTLTYGIAYIRDFVMVHHYIAESFETSVPWSQAMTLAARVKQRIRDEHHARNLPGEPFISCRVTQVYPTGVCIYFYFAFYYKGVANPSQVYHEIENAARDEVLRCGGSLSHHHGIGKLRLPFMNQVLSPAALSWRVAAKKALDPTNVFGCGNLTAPGVDP